MPPAAGTRPVAVAGTLPVAPALGGAVGTFPAWMSSRLRSGPVPVGGSEVRALVSGAAVVEWVVSVISWLSGSREPRVASLVPPDPNGIRAMRPGSRREDAAYSIAANSSFNARTAAVASISPSK